MNQVSLVTLLFLALRGDIRESGTGFGKLAFLESSGRKPIRAQKEKDYCPELSHFGVKLKIIVTCTQGRYNPYEPTSFVIDLFRSLTLVPAAI